MNLPQQPVSVWTGLRGNRVILPGRFGGPMYPPNETTYGFGTGNRARRARRDRAAAAAAENPQASGAIQDGAAQNAEAAAPRRWMPRVSNPFSAMSIPSISLRGRNHRTETAPPTQPSPSQLEAGVVR